VGVGRYQSSLIQPLRYAARDAKSVARLLANPLCGAFPQEQIAVLTNRQARRAEIIRHLSKWLPERSREAEIALIYFACHGVEQRVGLDHEGYLLPFDADPENVVINGIAMNEVAHLIGGVKCKAVVVILDCCHSGHVLGSEGTIARTLQRDMAIKPASIEKLSGKGRFLIAACDDGQQSIESPELKHGLFTFHLLRGMEGKADRDGDGKVGIAELFNYVSAAVARDARDKFKCEQKPWFKGTWTDEVFLSRRIADSATPGQA
jgi:uncharacterized caspase-like protein